MIFIFVEFYKYVECFNIMNYVIFFISHKKNNCNKIFFQIKNKIYLQYIYKDKMTQDCIL